MSTPFDTKSQANRVPAAGHGASDAQVGYIARLLGEREWRNEAPGHVKRAAAISTTLALIEKAEAGEPGMAELHSIISPYEGRGYNLNAVLATVTPDVPEHAFVWASLTKAGASRMIDWLQGLTRKDDNHAEAELADDDAVPAGRYAITPLNGAANETTFYKVDRPTEGRWAGYVFVKMLVGPEEHRLSKAQGQAVLARIAAAGAEQASARYGHEIGECGVCGGRLTNDESRERGIGPICAAKMGW